MSAETGVKAFKAEFCRLFVAHAFGALFADVARTLQTAVQYKINVVLLVVCINT